MTNQETNYSVDTKRIQLMRTPQPVGYWRLCKGIITSKIPIYEKPTPAQIKNTEETFGWVFEDA